MAGRLRGEGIAVTALQDFAQENRAEVIGKSTWWVSEHVIKATVKNKSYAEFLSAERMELVDKATVFVSHAWDSQFDNLVNAIVAWCTENKAKFEETYVWIDIFSMNLEDTMNRSQLNDTYMRFLEKIKRAVIVLDDWNFGEMRDFQVPLPLWATRLWCLFEFEMLKEAGIRCTKQIFVAMKPI